MRGKGMSQRYPDIEVRVLVFSLGIVPVFWKDEGRDIIEAPAMLPTAPYLFLMNAFLRRRWWLLGCVALVLALSGLWYPLYYWPAEALRLKYQRIHDDMTVAEVTAILGQADNEPGTIGSWTRPEGKVIS